MSLKEEFYGEEWQKEAREVRKDTLKDGADRLLWKLLGKSARRVSVFRMSMAYSIFMTVLSPGGGALAEMLSVSGAFALLGLLTAAAGGIMFCRMRYKNEK